MIGDLSLRGAFFATKQSHLKGQKTHDEISPDKWEIATLAQWARSQ